MSKHDKSKTGGGLLDTIFGRPKAKSKTATTNGGRPISADSDSIGDLNDLHMEIMKLTIAEVDEKFIDILEDMNIPKDKRQPLLEKTLDEKRDMILMHFKGKQAKKRNRHTSKYLMFGIGPSNSSARIMARTTNLGITIDFVIFVLLLYGKVMMIANLEKNKDDAPSNDN